MSFNSSEKYKSIVTELLKIEQAEKTQELVQALHRMCPFTELACDVIAPIMKSANQDPINALRKGVRMLKDWGFSWSDLVGDPKVKSCFALTSSNFDGEALNGFRSGRRLMKLKGLKFPSETGTPPQESFDFGHAKNVLWGNLPCSSCHGAEHQVANLNNIKLGHCDRHILLSAPKPHTMPTPIGPQYQTPSAMEAHRRAIRKLIKVGLIETTNSPVIRLRTRKLVKLTVLGDQVMRQIGTAVCRNKRVRWASHQKELVQNLRKPLSELNALLQENLASERARIYKAGTGDNSLSLRLHDFLIRLFSNFC